MNYPYKWNCWTNSGSTLVNSLLWAYTVQEASAYQWWSEASLGWRWVWTPARSCTSQPCTPRPAASAWSRPPSCSSASGSGTPACACSIEVSSYGWFFPSSHVLSHAYTTEKTEGQIVCLVTDTVMRVPPKTQLSSSIYRPKYFQSFLKNHVLSHLNCIETPPNTCFSNQQLLLTTAKTMDFRVTFSMVWFPIIGELSS